MAAQGPHMSIPPTYTPYSEYVESPFTPTDEYVPNPNVSMNFKPVVVPQQTNIFMIKNFSPFARAYSPSLARLLDPISKDDFLSFIEGLNNAFISSPIFQAAHVAGGALLGSQVLPAQVVGGVFQIASVALSAGVSMMRVKSFMKKSNESLFAPRGLVVKITSTKNMMRAIKCTNVDEKGKLALPPLDELKDHAPQTGALIRHDGNATPMPFTLVEDPRMRRLRALEGYIAPLELETEPAAPKGMYDKYGGAPLRWMNRKQDKKLAKTASGSAASRIEKAPEVEAEKQRSDAEIEGIDDNIFVIMKNTREEIARTEDDEEKKQIEARADYETAILEGSKLTEMERRDTKIAEIYKKGDKKLEKIAKKEEKIAQRILWIVIMRQDGSVGDELLGVGSRES